MKKTLRQRLAEPGLIMAPGVYDMVSLRLADRMGFEALYMTGFGTVASHLGSMGLRAPACSGLRASTAPACD